jgi:glycerol-3-phosphate responsive antiterminator
MNKEELFLMNLIKEAKFITSYELQRKKDIECYDKIMESHPNYVYIIYIHIIKFKQKLTAFTSTKIRSLRHINNGILFTIL